MKRGFTITELLVVIGLIVALAGISFPIVRGMKRAANHAACLGQLRGLGTAMEGYLAENGDFFPQMKMGRKSQSGGNNVLEEVLVSYVDGPEAFRCPSDHEHFENTGCSYFWNHRASGLKKSRVLVLGSKTGATQIPLIHDKEAYHGDDDGTNFLFIDMSAGKNLDFDVDSE